VNAGKRRERDGRSADYCPNVFSGTGPSSRPGDWLKSDFQSAVFLVDLPHFLGQIPVAVLMAVRCQLSCILLLRIARKVAIATYSHQTVYATLCERLRRAAKPQKTDSKSADRKVMGVRPPLPAPFNLFIISILKISPLGNLCCGTWFVD
jgi:hypothetical protein